MSLICETLESVATATSSCPVTKIIMVVPNVAHAQSQVTVGFKPVVPVSTAAATSSATPTAYATLNNTAAATETVTPSIKAHLQLASQALGSSTLFARTGEHAASSAAAASSVVGTVAPVLLISVGNAVSSVTAKSVSHTVLNSTAAATSSARPGQKQSVTNTANAVSSVAPRREARLVLVSVATATSSVSPSNKAKAEVLTSVAAATSTLAARLDVTMLIGAVADASSVTFSRNPDLVAMVMNTETTAASWYKNFGYESIIQVGGRTFAVGVDGLYELTGDTDAGVQVRAVVESGFTDFGIAQTKHADTLYFGYTSAGQLSVDVEVKESGYPPQTYLLEQRNAGAPRASRVTPGKALWGRYWRFTIRNVAGADFTVHDATVDVAVSPRRVS